MIVVVRATIRFGRSDLFKSCGPHFVGLRKVFGEFAIAFRPNAVRAPRRKFSQPRVSPAFSQKISRQTKSALKK
jgi:hypothetical protein